MAIEQLIDSLNQLDDAHQEMLKWGQDKKEAVMRNDVNALIQIMNQESRILKQIALQEERRIAACQSFLQEKGIKSALQLTITELTRLVFDPEEKAALLRAQAKLSQTLGDLKQVNDLNQKLMEQSLTFIDYSLELLGGGSGQDATYQHPADKSGGGQRTGLFDARA
ncbi:flagellar protein FlgN [Paenibacillus macerans]|uniref:flagellar protein FlgN n=1 Tax=Paenibacillus macerans TaxID=44252 RepID=UPI003D3122A7